MRLCIATPLYPPESGGPATYAKTLEEGLPGLGWDVSLVKFGDVRRMPKGIRHAAYFFRVLRAAKRADVVLALDPVSVGLPAALAAGLARAPFIVKVVGDYAWEQGVQRSGITVPLDTFVRMGHVPLFVSFLRAVQTFVARRARTIIVPSEYLKGIVTQWQVDPQKIQVAYNAVSLDEQMPERSLAPRTIVSAARLVPWKGMRGLIDAVRDMPGVSLIIIGDGPERAALEAYASSQVTFLGALPHAETLSYIKAADCFVLNSTYEGLSHALIEALMLGTPIVASSAGGNPELITDGVNGLLVPVGDTQALASAIARTLDTKPAYEPAAAQETFALRTMLFRTSEILSSV